MRVSTYTRNAVNCIIDLAISPKPRVSLPSIAARQSVSVAYLEQIFAKLRRAGLISAVRGPGGGYSLMRDADSISVADIMRAVEDRVDATGCAGSRNCRSGDQCLSHDLWAQLNSRICQFLDGVTLQQLVAGAQGEGKELPVINMLFETQQATDNSQTSRQEVAS